MFMLYGGHVPFIALFSCKSNRTIVYGSKNCSSFFCWKCVTLKWKTTE